jgi:hypothetical protein
MKTFVRHASALAAFGALAFVTFAACDAFEPEVGPLRSDPGALSSDDAAPEAGVDPRCLPGAAPTSPVSACDACVKASCCAPWLACADDAACSSADGVLDTCVAAAVDYYRQPDPVAAAKCWSTFAAKNAEAKARVDCESAQCKTACAVP